MMSLVKKAMCLFMISALQMSAAVSEDDCGTPTSEAWCWYLMDPELQGCNPDGYPYQFIACPTDCDEFLEGCDGGDYFFKKGEDWDYTNGTMYGFKEGRPSYHRWIYDYDIWNICMTEGECVCEFIVVPLPGGGSGYTFECAQDDPLHAWEDWTVSYDEETTCDPSLWNENGTCVVDPYDPE